MSNFQPGPVQEANVELRSGLKIQCFRRDPSKFFADIQKWFEGLDIKKIENWTATADPSGHLTLIIAYRDTKTVDPTLEIVSEAIGLVCDLADNVKELTVLVDRMIKDSLPEQRPPVSSLSQERDTVEIGK